MWGEEDTSPFCRLRSEDGQEKQPITLRFVQRLLPRFRRRLEYPRKCSCRRRRLVAKPGVPYRRRSFVSASRRWNTDHFTRSSWYSGMPLHRYRSRAQRRSLCCGRMKEGGGEGVRIIVQWKATLCACMRPGANEVNKACTPGGKTIVFLRERVSTLSTTKWW